MLSISPSKLPSTSLVPASIKILPSFTHFEFIKFGIPVPEIKISAWFVNNSGFLVSLFIEIIVASVLASQFKVGYPTNFPCPITATVLPFKFMLDLLKLMEFCKPTPFGLLFMTSYKQSWIACTVGHKTDWSNK